MYDVSNPEQAANARGSGQIVQNNNMMNAAPAVQQNQARRLAPRMLQTRTYLCFRRAPGKDKVTVTKTTQTIKRGIVSANLAAEYVNYLESTKHRNVYDRSPRVRGDRLIYKLEDKDHDALAGLHSKIKARNMQKQIDESNEKMQAQMKKENEEEVDEKIEHIAVQIKNMDETSKKRILNFLYDQTGKPGFFGTIFSSLLGTNPETKTHAWGVPLQHTIELGQETKVEMKELKEAINETGTNLEKSAETVQETMKTTQEAIKESSKNVREVIQDFLKEGKSMSEKFGVSFAERMEKLSDQWKPKVDEAKVSLEKGMNTVVEIREFIQKIFSRDFEETVIDGILSIIWTIVNAYFIPSWKLRISVVANTLLAMGVVSISANVNRLSRLIGDFVDLTWRKVTQQESEKEWMNLMGERPPRQRSEERV